MKTALFILIALHSETTAAWNTYVQMTEKRIARELDDATPGFLVMDFLRPADMAEARRTLQQGHVYVQKMKTVTPAGGEVPVPHGMIHHWYGAIFIPAAQTGKLLKFVQDYDRHQQYFPEVEQSRLQSHDGNTYDIILQLKRTKIVTVHYRTFHTVQYQLYGSGSASSRSVTTQIRQLENAGTSDERMLPEGNDDGYLWRLNSYWRFKETDKGVIVECESVSLSRSIPYGLGWLIGDVVDSLPKESLESMLGAIRDQVR